MSKLTTSPKTSLETLERNPARILQRLTPSRYSEDGFTLIELMIVVAIIGILSTVAISSYQTYVIRAQVAEGLTLASNAKAPIMDVYLQTGEAPASREEAGMSNAATDTLGKYVSSVDVVNGRVDVTFGREANLILENRTLSLTPYESDSEHIVWRCGDSDAPVNNSGTALAPMGTAGGGNASSYAQSTVPPQYLPAPCR